MYVRQIAKGLINDAHEVPVQGEYFRALVNTEDKVLIDQRNVRLGEKITDWEQSGYPVRIECGERDMEARKCVVVSRITGEKVIISIEEVEQTVARMHEEGQSALRAKSKQRLMENTVPCTTLDEVGVALESGKFALYAWDRDPKLEAIIKDKWKGTTRCLPFEGQFTDALLPLKDQSLTRVIIARSF